MDHQFSQNTTVLSIPHPNFSLEAFSFKPIVELLRADKIDNSILINIIGEVVGKENPREFITSEGRETKRLTILIEGIDIGCMLFGDMVDQILPYLEEERMEPLIVIAQCFKLSKRLSGKLANSARISQVSSHDLRFGADELKKGNVVVKTIEEDISSTQARIINGMEDSVTSLKEKILAKRATMGMKPSLPMNVNNEDELGFSTNKFSRKG
ncbi:hypothetical protein AHAS_Ahas07G0092600 [Arachis hypogaea]